MRLALLGATIGVVAALMLGRFLRGLLFGVDPNDPLTLAAVVATVLAAAALAVLVPAVRARETAPTQALRD
jgi:putative ABC transport system permease protein